MKTPSPLAQKMIAYLDCPCEVFAPMRDDDPLHDAYMAAREQSRRDGGFLPVLVKVDETLWDCLCANASGPEDGDPEAARAWRQRLLASELPDGEAYLRGTITRRRADCDEDEIDWEELLGEVSEGEVSNRFTSYWDFETEMTAEVILARIPAEKPWQVIAWLPFGGWNECPDTPELMAAARYWYGKYGAVPGAVSHDELEFILDAPVKAEAAGELALEQYGLCPDLVEQCMDEGTVGQLRDSLGKSTVWYFWWD